MFAGRPPFGFYNAPVSKALLVITGTASALNLILFQSFRLDQSVQLLNYIQNSPYSNIIFKLMRLFYYSNVKNLLFGTLLLYNFRIFELRYGSRKFANYLLASSVVGNAVEYITYWVLLSPNNFENISTGPFRLIFSLFVPFYLSLPSVGTPNILGLIPVTGKLFTYVIGLQMLLQSRSTMVAGISGLFAGVMCHFNFANVSQWLQFPDNVSNFCSGILGPYFRSSTPADENRIYGATLEIQRQQRMDELDQQMWRLQEMNLTRRTVHNPNVRREGFAQVLVGNQPAPLQQPMTEVSEEQVQRLIEMGFTRQAVLQALTASNNDMTVAMNILLAE